MLVMDITGEVLIGSTLIFVVALAALISSLNNRRRLSIITTRQSETLRRQEEMHRVQEHTDKNIKMIRLALEKRGMTYDEIDAAIQAARLRMEQGEEYQGK
jgi:uncharacterized membrane protein YhiD involved in acid resistance